MPFNLRIENEIRFPWQLEVGGLIRLFCNLVTAEQEGIRLCQVEGVKTFYIKYVTSFRTYTIR